MLKFVFVVISSINNTPTCHVVFENVQDALQVGRAVHGAVIDLAEIDV